VGTALGTAQTVVALSRMASAAAFGVLWYAAGPAAAATCVALLLVPALVCAAVLLRTRSGKAS
jgi:hypothetical protein